METYSSFILGECSTIYYPILVRYQDLPVITPVRVWKAKLLATRYREWHSLPIQDDGKN